MTAPTLLWLCFPLAITLHNLEEARWLPQWSRHAGRFHAAVAANEFHFAVLVVTVLAYLATFAAVLMPDVPLARQIFFGFLGAMILNTFVPHLAATLALKRYAPGLLTGIALLLPINATILARALTAGTLSWGELVISTIIVGAVLLAALPVLFRIGRATNVE